MTVSRVRLGSSDLEVSRLVYGAWRLAESPAHVNPARTAETVATCLELGITTFDHADIYGDYQCEKLFGDALAYLGADRNRLELVTKCGIKLASGRRGHRVKHYDTGQDHLVKSVENSLRALRTDRVDVLLIHRPDPLMDPDEVARTFNELRKTGKVLHFGVSNFLPHQVDLLASRLPFPLVTNQIEVNVLKTDALHDGTIDQCQRLRITPMAWSPLAGGGLFGGQGDRERNVLAALTSVAKEHPPATTDQIAVAWLLSHPARIVPVVGSQRTERIRAAAAADAIVLTREQWFQVWSASAGREVP